MDTNVIMVNQDTGEILEQVFLGGDSDAFEIGKLYRKAGSSLVDSVRYQVECGQKLALKKQTLKHGEWLPWLKEQADVLGFGERAARMLMGQANRQLTSDLTPPEAIAISRQTWGNDSQNHRAQGTGENEWYTPAQYLDAARKVMGNIDLDPATSEIAQHVVQAGDYYTEADNGLTQDWFGRVWLNPPYSKELIGPFIQKLLDEVGSGRVDEAIVLTHNYTDTAWFHNAESGAARICFTRGRIAFESPEGEKCAPTQGQAFFYYGQNPERFEQVFVEFGFVR
jgi:phage N-6-adenine-methyltransferase